MRRDAPEIDVGYDAGVKVYTIAPQGSDLLIEYVTLNPNIITIKPRSPGSHEATVIGGAGIRSFQIAAASGNGKAGLSGVLLRDGKVQRIGGFDAAIMIPQPTKDTRGRTATN